MRNPKSSGHSSQRRESIQTAGEKRGPSSTLRTPPYMTKIIIVLRKAEMTPTTKAIKRREMTPTIKK